LKSALGYRDRVILELMYSSGLRNSEIQKLKTQDLNLDEGVVQILDGKGNKDRIVPITGLALRLLRHFVKTVRPDFLKPNDALEFVFHNFRGQKLSPYALTLIIEKYLKLLGSPKRITPHCIRHTCATHLLSHGMNLRHIQELLGHSDLRTTQVYTRVEIGDLRRTLAKCHPRNTDPSFTSPCSPMMFANPA
jgi:integrase/recombinase XerD